MVVRAFRCLHQIFHFLLLLSELSLISVLSQGQSQWILSHRFDRISSWIFPNLHYFLATVLTECCNSLGCGCGLVIAVVLRSRLFDLRVIRGWITVWLLLSCCLWFDRLWFLVFMGQEIDKLILFLIFKMLIGRLWLVSTWLNQLFGSSLSLSFVFSMYLVISLALALDCLGLNCMIVFGRCVLLADVQCGGRLLFCETLLWLSITFGVICLILLASKVDNFCRRKSYFLSQTRTCRQW